MKASTNVIGIMLEKELGRALRRGALRVAGNGVGVERGRIDVEAGARAKDVDHDQADDQREVGDDLEVEPSPCRQRGRLFSCRPRRQCRARPCRR